MQPSTSFEPVLKEFAGSLPPAFRNQFLRAGPVKLEGVMHRIWHKPALHPMFWIMGKFGVLIPKTGAEVPTTLIIEPTPKGQLWRRTLDFDKPVEFTSLNTFEPREQRVVEWIGPGQLVGMVWEVTFAPPRRLSLVTIGWVIRLGKRNLPVPGWLWPWTLGRADTSQHADEMKEDTIHIELTIRHALFGEMFEYNGTFQVK